jgi:hypothetical protein
MTMLARASSKLLDKTAELLAVSQEGVSSMV